MIRRLASATANACYCGFIICCYFAAALFVAVFIGTNGEDLEDV